ncbi:MAG: methylase domain protein [Streptosporangiaceae bacterium]|nr:methylase domain protein [Streptosporangiaceae bacterium]
MTAAVVRADARNLPLPDASVDLIVTSPPYSALRDYRDGDGSLAGQIGAESTPREYIEALLECTREWTRVLKPSGSIFVNLGDKYGPDKSLLYLPERYRIGTRDSRGAATQSGTGKNTADVYLLADEARAALGGYAREYLLRRPTSLAYVCACAEPTAPTRPSVVVDPFGGTGTTALAARALGRNAISFDLSHDYARLAQWRTTDPGELARVLGKPKPPPVVPGQGDLFANEAIA